MDRPVDWPAQDLLSHRVAATPDRTALIDADRDRSLTVRELDAAVDRRAAALAGQEDAPTVALLLDTRPAVAEVAFATMRLGGTLVPLNVRLTESELGDQLDRVDPDVLVCESDTEAAAVAVTDVSVRSVDEPARTGVDPLVPTGDRAVEPATVHPDDDQLVLFTSGTTGEPKGVRLTAGNLVASATASAFRLGVDPADRWLCCLPTYHMGGFAPLVRSVLYGTTVVVQREFEPAATADALVEYGVTGLSLVPTLLDRLLDEGWEPPEQLGTVLLGGAPASQALLDRCEAADVPVYPTYGTTETASGIATATPAQAFANEGTVGQPHVNMDVTIVDGDGIPCDAGQEGEIVVDGPAVTPGYLDPATTAEAFGEYGLHTGDVGYRDSEGRLWITGRADDRIVTGGETVDPAAVTAVLREHPDVQAAAVVGVADPEWGERVAALVVPETDVDLDAAAVEAHCREELAGFKLPRTIAFADRLPRTASGTVDRERVRELLADRREPSA